MNIIPLALIFLGIATLIAVLSIPLIMRKIPMNPFYGVRFPQSFKSEKNWYEINHYGGKVLLLSNIPISIAALTGVFFSDSFGAIASEYLMVVAIVTCASLCTAVVVSYIRAKHIDEQNK